MSRDTELAAAIANDPGDMLVVRASEPDARRHSKERVDRVFRQDYGGFPPQSGM